MIKKSFLSIFRIFGLASKLNLDAGLEINQISSCTYGLLHLKQSHY